ncbi:hypothetical protein N7457_009527 [Penicillium paradoxum]|uniref:uncharacterized protein n=1 Tax=Penicillium paradoxum TaxID=176176 RepID=UPI0025485B38|nr:uncharacterized protein N7457_009527 [Penicillium paradoxum]KAJ5774631.1 hypothetical protein N7457_009527 [Penicillium paradoxum]
MNVQGSSRAGLTASAAPIDSISPSRVYNITRPLLHRHYIISSADDQPLLYGEISSFTPNKPDLTLHAGASSQAPIVAVSNFLKLSGNYKLGIGNPDAAGNMIWEDMTKELIHKPKYRFEMIIPLEPDQSQGERRAFLWKRTHSVGIGDSAPSKWTTQNYKLVNERTEKVLAVSSGATRPGRVGKLQIRVEYGEEFDRMVLISCLSLYEKARRRRHHAAGGGGGGGG